MNGQLNNQMGPEPIGKTGAVRRMISKHAKRLGPALLRASFAASPYTIPYTLYLGSQRKHDAAPAH